MVAEFGGLGFGVPEFDLDNDLPGSLRAGLDTLLLAAEERGLPEETVTAVFEAAFSPFSGFRASQVEGYNEMVDLSIAVNGREWTEACLVAPDRRATELVAVSAECLRYAAKHFPRLHEHDRIAVVDSLLYIELSGTWIDSTAFEGFMPAWLVPGVVYYRLPKRLSDAKRMDETFGQFTVRHGDEDELIYFESLDRPLNSAEEGGGAFGDLARPLWEVSVDAAAIEAAVWATARANLAQRGALIVDGTRAGAARDKQRLTVEAALWVLTRGCKDSPREDGKPLMGSAEEFRRLHADDALLASFAGLRAAAPETWGVFSDARVPVLDDLKAAAREAEASNRARLEWFTKVSARKNDLHKKAAARGTPGVLHCVRHMVDALIEEAASDTNE